MKTTTFKTNFLLGLIVSLLVFQVGCGDDEEVNDATSLIPVILSVSPTSGSPGDPVTITGTDLNGATTVNFGTITTSIITNTATEISTTVPEGASTGKVSVTTPGGTAVSAEDFEVIIVGAATVTSVSRISAQAGENITVTGTEMATVSSATIGGVEATVVEATETAVELTVGDSPLGLSTITLVNDGGSVTTSTDVLTFYVIEILPEFNETFDGEEVRFSSGGDAEITAFGISNVITGATRLPAAIQGNFYHIEGISDLDDSGSYTGQIGHSTQDAGYFADFFTVGSDVADYYYNVNVNFGALPTDYDDVMAGFRLRFDEGYDADGDGSTSDEYLEFRPTPSGLTDLGYAADENGWYALSISFDQFIESGPRDGAGSWAVYSADQMTRFALASRREHAGEYSLSFDNLFITKGGPYSFPE
ncbi:MAG: IPT/TIG domain-containing protein [Cyclobacteriaceae bacterium]